MIATRFTELVGCAVPIQQAGHGIGCATGIGGSGVAGRCPRDAVDPLGPG